MSYLVVVAHPDDEVLGAGATILKLTAAGKEVHVCILSGNADARQHRPSKERLAQDTLEAMQKLGVKSCIKGDFPNISFNTVAHLEIVQFIEKTIQDTAATVIFTHHPADLNQDHYHTSVACQAAVRIFQRQANKLPLQELLFMEVLSSTEWSLNPAIRPFTPNVFVEVGSAAIAQKIEALRSYGGVMRDFPHPRSVEGIQGLAAYRGVQAGLLYAEAFESVFRQVRVAL